MLALSAIDAWMILASKTELAGILTGYILGTLSLFVTFETQQSKNSINLDNIEARPDPIRVEIHVDIAKMYIRGSQERQIIKKSDAEK
ncbi:MAG: hypothetical protein GXN93_04890 [Candidatus Diapherotrites archaeon]|nr:hypothetical protein [Candidatus Diapherotrites archaeon]